MRTLIVEDEEFCSDILVKFMKPFGQCEVVKNGQEAVEAFKKAKSDGIPYDLIYLDIHMPVMNGYEALKCIRELESDAGTSMGDEVKIIMVTTADSMDERVEAFHSRCTSYIVKPFDIAKAKKAIESLLPGRV